MQVNLTNNKSEQKVKTHYQPPNLTVLGKMGTLVQQGNNAGPGDFDVGDGTPAS